MIDEERLKAHMENGETEYVMCAAIWVDNGKHREYQPYNIPSGIVMCGWRHPCIFQQMPDNPETFADVKKTTQGFLTNKNRFLTREEAYDLVKRNGQLTKPLIGAMLTSEDLW